MYANLPRILAERFVTFGEWIFPRRKEGCNSGTPEQSGARIALPQSSLRRFEFANPDIAVVHRMVMILQRQRQFFWLRFIWWPFAVSRRAAQFHVVLHQYAVVKNGFACRAEQLTVFRKTRTVKNDIVSLPLARRARSVHQRRVLAVDRRGLAVRVSLALVGVQDLRLVEPLQENAAVAAVLAFAFGRRRFRELDVQLAVAEGFARIDVTRLGHNFGITVFDLPFRGGAVLVRPFGKILAIEKNCGIRRRTTGRILRAWRSGIDRRRHGTIGIVNFPFGVDLRVTDCRHTCQQQSTNRNEENLFHGLNLITEAEFYPALR